MPCLSHSTMTTRMLAMIAEAGLVPWAEDGIRQMLRCVSPRLSWNLRIASRPAYSPWAPEFGCMQMASKPVIAHSQLSSSLIISR
ncbi:hypothetical protein D9M71_383990 [compost metagenome]